MYNRSRPFVVCLILCMFVVVLMPRPTQAAQFVLAGWSFPDEYGQGIYLVTPYQNSSGSFVTIPNPDTGIGNCYPENTTFYELNFTDSTALRFDVRVRVNYTNLGLSHPDDFDIGMNFARVGIEMSTAGTSVFSLQNMPYDDLGWLYETGIWWYSYVDVVEAILVAGQIYSIVFTLEVYLEV